MINKVENVEEPVVAKKAKKVVDPAMAEAIKTKKNRRKEARFAARDKIIDFVKTFGDDEIKGMALKLWPGAYTGKKGAVVNRSTVSPKDFLISLFPNGVGTTKSGMEIFAEHNLGPAEMRGKIIRNLKLAEPADRVWVAYEYAEKQYRLVAIGPDMPEGWTGFRPVDMQ